MVEREVIEGFIFHQILANSFRAKYFEQTKGGSGVPGSSWLAGYSQVKRLLNEDTKHLGLKAMKKAAVDLAAYLKENEGGD